MSDDNQNETPNLKDVLNEYFRLKNKFENEMDMQKKKILNNGALSKKEKRAEYLKLMPKCINCKRPSKNGTIFSVTYKPDDEENESYRIFKVLCGNLADPCNLHIEFELGKVESLENILNEIQEDIRKHKNEIIDDKNKLLFGLMTTEVAIEKFENNKSYITQLTTIYEQYLDRWSRIVDNPEKKEELDESLVKAYECINQIKDCMQKMNQNDDAKYAEDAVNIYHTTLQPLFNKIRHLKYSENMVYNDENTGSCKLLQSKYTVHDINMSNYSHKIVQYNMGYQAKKPPNNQQIESAVPGEISISIKDPAEAVKEDITDEPIIGKGADGIEWTKPEYIKLWTNLPPKLKNEFKLNIDWMNEFMFKCVNDRRKPGFNGCKLIAPPNLVIPPRVSPSGQYDFGVSIYNYTFNKLPESQKKMSLTFYKEDPVTKAKDYSMLIRSLNEDVGQEVGFGRGFF